MSRYEIIEGSYTGTSDDVAGRWYIVDREGDIIDKRGRGRATRSEAADALIERLTMGPGAPDIAPADLVGVAEIGERAGVKADTVHAWRSRHADFPAPIVQLAAGPVWTWSDVARWLAVPRRAGRPAKA